MAFRFIGIQRVDFTPEGSSKPMKGYNFHFTDDTYSPNVVGEIPFKNFVSDERASSFLDSDGMTAYVEHIGKPCELAFNRRGKVESIKFLK